LTKIKINKILPAIIPAMVVNHSLKELIFIILFKKNKNILNPIKIRSIAINLFMVYIQI